MVIAAVINSDYDMKVPGETEGLFTALRQSAKPKPVSAIEKLITDAPDCELCRINVLAFAARHNLNEEDVIAAFLHGARLGIFDMSWNILCPRCGGVLDSGATLKTVQAEYRCVLCAIGCEPTLDEMVEVTFTISLRVNVTSTISSSVGSHPIAQRTHRYSAWTVLSVAPESRTPPQRGQRMFQDISKIPSRAPCKKAAITSSSLRLCLAAKARTLMRHSSQSGASVMSFSMALTGFGFADCRNAVKRPSVSPGTFMS